MRRCQTGSSPNVSFSRYFCKAMERCETAAPEPGFVTHNLGGGYYFRSERVTFSVNLGVSNILNRPYTEQFVYAPARAFVHNWNDVGDQINKKGSAD